MPLPADGEVLARCGLAGSGSRTREHGSRTAGAKGCRLLSVAHRTRAPGEAKGAGGTQAAHRSAPRDVAALPAQIRSALRARSHDARDVAQVRMVSQGEAHWTPICLAPQLGAKKGPASRILSSQPCALSGRLGSEREPRNPSPASRGQADGNTPGPGTTVTPGSCSPTRYATRSLAQEFTSRQRFDHVAVPAARANRYVECPVLRD